MSSAPSSTFLGVLTLIDQQRFNEALHELRLITSMSDLEKTVLVDNLRDQKGGVYIDDIHHLVRLGVPFTTVDLNSDGSWCNLLMTATRLVNAGRLTDGEDWLLTPNTTSVAGEDEIVDEFDFGYTSILQVCADVTDPREGFFIGVPGFGTLVRTFRSSFDPDTRIASGFELEICPLLGELSEDTPNRAASTIVVGADMRIDVDGSFTLLEPLHEEQIALWQN